MVKSDICPAGVFPREGGGGGPGTACTAPPPGLRGVETMKTKTFSRVLFSVCSGEEQRLL